MKSASFRASVLAVTVLAAAAFSVGQERATVTEVTRLMKTFPYSDPDPAPLIGPLYPYFRFAKFSASPIDKEWKMVKLENPFVRVFVTPEIGGKIWGAIEKASGKEFIYFNKGVEFREIALRGPYTAGGIELNFGYIGHAPSTASPVDYLFRTLPDGSASCVVGTIDLPSRSQWRVEVRVPRDGAYFETECLWYNPTPLRDSYYNWVTASAIAGPDLRFFYPGTNHIGHGGEVGRWPVDAKGRDISHYRNNAFESHKSYHILGELGESFGGYWEEGNFGYGHWAPYSDHPGMKLWLWSLGRDGEIWTDLLLEGEKYNYIEMQTGLLYNQAAETSSLTPFKHYGLEPYSVHRWKEIWFPVKDIGGLVTASPHGALNVTRDGQGGLRIGLSPIRPIDDDLTIWSGGRKIFSKHLSLAPMESFIQAINSGDKADDDGGEITVDLGNGKLRWSSLDKERNKLDRPLASPPDYDWTSAEGLFQAGEELVRQREWERAMRKFEDCLAKEPHHLKALTRLSELHFRRAEYGKARECARTALAVHTYDPEANFIYGCVNRALGKRADAKDGFGWASRSMALRTASYTELAALACAEKDFERAADYARRSIDFNTLNVPGYEILAAAYRHLNNTDEAGKAAARLLEIDPLNHAARFERYLAEPTADSLKSFASMVRNELPHETYLEIAAFYAGLGLEDDARRVLEAMPPHPLGQFWLAHLLRDKAPAESRALADKAGGTTPAFVFPFRKEMIPVLEWAVSGSDSWKPKYYLALLFWNVGRGDEARALFERCGEAPDFAPFYLARAKFIETAAQFPEGKKEAAEGPNARILSDLKRAQGLDSGDWKIQQALFSRCVTTGRFAEALEVARKASQKEGAYFILAMDYAKALLIGGKYESALEVLKSARILPYEGAWEGRDLHRQANLYLASREIAKKRYRQALRFVEAARAWPEHLGVGKPFDTDERLENYLAAVSHERAGDRRQAEKYYEAVVADSRKFGDSWDASRYISALAMTRRGMNGQAGEFILAWKKKFPDCPAAAWASAKMSGDEKKAGEILAGLEASIPGYPWNLAAFDREFPVVLEILRLMR